MTIYKLSLMLTLISFSSMTTAASTFDLVLSGKECSSWNNQINCTYTIDDDFKFEIAGVGDDYASVVFSKSDINNNYYGKFGLKHGCVIVVNAKDLSAGFAFVNPTNGKVYRDWQSCGSKM